MFNINIDDMHTVDVDGTTCIADNDGELINIKNLNQLVLCRDSVSDFTNRLKSCDSNYIIFEQTNILGEKTMSFLVKNDYEVTDLDFEDWDNMITYGSSTWVPAEITGAMYRKLMDILQPGIIRNKKFAVFVGSIHADVDNAKLSCFCSLIMQCLHTVLVRPDTEKFNDFTTILVQNPDIRIYNLDKYMSSAIYKNSRVILTADNYASINSTYSGQDIESNISVITDSSNMSTKFIAI
jgi:hypothetical protein